jgi:hypothetical protein
MSANTSSAIANDVATETGLESRAQAALDQISDAHCRAQEALYAIEAGNSDFAARSVLSIIRCLTKATVAIEALSGVNLH